MGKFYHSPSPIVPLPHAGEGNFVSSSRFAEELGHVGWRALPPALATISCGCFLPDLTRFTRLQCGEARRNRSGIIRNYKAFIAGLSAGAHGFPGYPDRAMIATKNSTPEARSMVRSARRSAARFRALTGIAAGILSAALAA